MEQFKRKIFGYAVTRVLPSTSSISPEDFMEDSGIIIPNLIHLLNFYDVLNKLTPS